MITGTFNHHVENFPNALHIVNGIVEAVQITMQIAFIIDLKRRILPLRESDSKPGRQVTIFLFLLNLAQWIVFTFEIQKASVTTSCFIQCALKRSPIVEHGLFFITPFCKTRLCCAR